MKKQTIVLLVSSFLMSSSFAQSILYRYKDDKGQTIYTDKYPDGTRKLVDVISTKSMTMMRQVKPGELTTEEVQIKQEQEKDAKSTLMAEIVNKQKSQALLTQYASVNDIEKMRDFELRQITQAITNDTDQLNNLKQRITEIDKELKIPNNPNTTRLQQEQQNIQSNIQLANKNLETNKLLYEQRNSKYNDDKLQYQKLLEQMGKSQTGKTVTESK